MTQGYFYIYLNLENLSETFSQTPPNKFGMKIW